MYWDWNFIDVKNKRAEVYTLQNIMVEKNFIPKRYWDSCNWILKRCLVTNLSRVHVKPWVEFATTVFFSILLYFLHIQWLGLEGEDMNSPVAQSVEHPKLNREVPGLFPRWGVLWCLERKNQNSSAGKWTRDLPIKLWVLYQLSYQGIHVLPLQA